MNMWVEDYQWHYDYVRLAWDTGFSFEKCKSPNVDKNKICIVDIDRIIKERDVATVDRYIPTVIQYILEEEQAKVLDTNFVKMFRISQLAVEFLLFCKKYLDNTVILLKKELTKNREEFNELKIFTEELQSHITALTRQQPIATFRCSTCSKMFSSEEYLNSHIKRRHSIQGGEPYNSETDKLNLEIKELKERLNNTEKLLKEKDDQNYINSEPNNDVAKVNEVLERFERFREQVNVEIKELRLQKSFYEENYGKLFDIVVNNKENVEPKLEVKVTPRIESTTQTDKVLQIENIQNRNVLEIHESSQSSPPSYQEKRHTRDIDVKETLEAKISETLSGIESQMQAFWNKLNAIEQNKNTGIETIPNNVNNIKTVQDKEEIKPKIKPRSKLTHPTQNTMISNNAETIRKAIEKMENEVKIDEKQKIQQQENTPVMVKTVKNVTTSLQKISKNASNLTQNTECDKMLEEIEVTSESEYSESEESESQSEASAQKSQNSQKFNQKDQKTPVKNEILRSENNNSNSLKKLVNNKQVLKMFRKEVEVILVNRLQDLGISENWKTLPQRSFDRALEIINHQAELTKKSYNNFNSIKKKIEADVSKKCSDKSINISKAVSPKKKMVKTQNVIKIGYRPKTSRSLDSRPTKANPKHKTVEIKNRSLYETDTESETNVNSPQNAISSVNVIPSNLAGPQQMYSNVVKELKSLPVIRSPTKDSDSEDINKAEDHQKGVLKSFPSVGSLSKKKVLFDLESDSSKIEDFPVIQKTGGSTTSIASSILEDRVENNKQESVKDTKNKESKDNGQEFEDLSDFDFSDM